MKRLVVVSLGSLALALGTVACGDGEQDPRDGQPVGTGSVADGAGADGGENAGGGETVDVGEAADGSAPPQPAEPGDRYSPEQRGGRVRGDGSIQRFGDRLPDAAAAEIVAVAVGYYDARAERDWERACGLLSSSLKRQFVRLAERAPKLEVEGCADSIAAFSGGVPREVLVREARETRFNEVRVKGDRAFALFKSGATPAGALPLIREGGRWKVAALVGIPL